MNRDHEFEFSNTQTIEMASFVSELVRQGVTYKVTTLGDGWKIELLGGY